MSKYSACALAVALAAAFVAGCVSPTSFNGYLEDRRQDLIDVVHVDVSTVNVGAVAYVGPFMLGLDTQKGLAPGERTATVQIGLGGARFDGRDGTAFGIIFPTTRWDEDRPFLGRRPKKSPGLLAVGVNAGVIFGVGAEADVLELLDFVAGLFCLDLVGDDEHVEQDKGPQPEPKAQPKAAETGK